MLFEIEEKHKIRLSQIAAQRLEAGKKSQANESKSKEAAKDLAKAKEKYEKLAKKLSKKKRASSITDRDRRITDGRMKYNNSELENQASQDPRKLKRYKKELDKANKAALEAYAEDAKDADEIAQKLIDEENVRYETEKKNAIESAANNQPNNN